MTTQVKFGEWIEKGFNLYKENFGLLILTFQVAGLLNAISFGILAGPMAAGTCLIILRLIDKTEPKPNVGDVFNGFSFFLQSFLFLLVWGIIIIIPGFILSIIPCLGPFLFLFANYAMITLLIFSIPLIADKKMDFWPASMQSINLIKTNFWAFLGFVIVSLLISGVGAIACGIGVFFTIPIGYCAIIVAYRDIVSGSGSTPPAPPEPPTGQQGTPVTVI